METVVYMAHGTPGTNYGETPRKAAQIFFEKNPTARKISVTEGRLNGDHVVVVYGSASENQWPDYWPDITKRSVPTLPDVTRQHGGPSIKNEETKAPKPADRKSDCCDSCGEKFGRHNDPGSGRCEVCGAMILPTYKVQD